MNKIIHLEDIKNIRKLEQQVYNETQIPTYDISHWNAYEKGPCRDTLGELKESCNSLGIEVGVSSHRAEHWFFMDGGKQFDSDIKEPMQRGDLYWPAMPLTADFHDIFSEPAPSEEYLQDWLIRACELVDRYRPKVVYFDW